MEDLTVYDIKPENFLNYLRYYGEHFNKKLCEFACSQMDGTLYTKDKVDALLKAHGVDLGNTKMYDYVYLANWCKVTLLGSSILDEKRLTLFIKDILDKEGGLIFNRWYADMAKRGIPIEWEDMI